jgi:MerR family mercuric resistance operon transcriptional regulator
MTQHDDATTAPSPVIRPKAASQFGEPGRADAVGFFCEASLTAMDLPFLDMPIIVHPVATTGAREKSMQPLTIGRLAAAAGVNLETVRYYERIKLMPSPGRTASGHRVYEDGDVRRLAFIRRGRELGFNIEQIRALLKLSEPTRASCAEVNEIARMHLDEVRAKLADLVRLEDILAATIPQCSGDAAPSCPVLEMLTTSARL